MGNWPYSNTSMSWEERYVSYDIHDTSIVTFYKELGLSLQLQQLR